VDKQTIDLIVQFAWTCSFAPSDKAADCRGYLGSFSSDDTS